MNETSETKEFRDAERLDLPSASALSIVVACPGQPRFLASLPREALVKPTEEDEWAKKGSRLHLAFETGNVNELDSEEHETYQQGLKFEEEIVNKWMDDKALEEAEEGPRELRVFLHDPRTMKPIGSAKLDRHYIAKDPRDKRVELLVIDLKSGWNTQLPPSPKAWQLRYQAVCLFAEEYEGVTGARVAFCKPKFKCGAGDFADYSAMDLKYSLESIMFHLWESTQEDAPRHAGKQCSWCPAKAYCPEAGAYALLPSVIANNIVPTEGVKQLVGADLVKIWEMSTIVNKIVEAVKTRLKLMPEDELEALGLYVNGGKKLDPVTDTKGCFHFLRGEEHHWTEPDVFKCLSFSKTDLAAVRMIEAGIGNKAAQEWIATALQPFITKQTSGGSICQGQNPKKLQEQEVGMVP